MGFLTGLFCATVKTALTPVAIVKDAIDIVQGEAPQTTKDLLQSVVEDVEEASDELGDGNLL